LRETPLERCDLIELLHRERQPVADLGIQRLLVRKVHRHVLQGASGRDPQPFAEAVMRRFERREGGVQIGAPDVAAIDDAKRQNLRLRVAVQERRELPRPADQVEMNAGDRQRLEHGRVLRHGLEVGGKQDPGRHGCESLVRRLEGVQPALIRFKTQYRFVDLHPGHAQDPEAGK